MQNDLPEPVRLVLQRRGLNRRFIQADYSSLSDWRDVPGAAEAAAVIHSSLEKNQKILIHGDFDADGITAAATAIRVLRHLGANVLHHLPCRFEEGYGLGEEGVRRCIEEDVDLLVTVDCGITAVDQVDELNRAGVRTVITDHHVAEEVLPCADAVVNPQISPEKDAPWSNLSGAGVIHTVLRGLFSGNVTDLPGVMNPDLVAIGTVCDMVELTGDNRILVKKGLEILSGAPVPGISALLRESGTGPGNLSSFDLGFGLGPRINSAGRVTHADTALQLLLEEDPRRAAELSAQLEISNRKRKNLDRGVYEQALDMLSGTESGIAVAGSEHWHPGVIGISASRISRKLNRPAILISWDGETGRGSARGLPGMEVHTLLASAMDAGLLEKFGGHSMAAGLTVSRKKFKAFSDFAELMAKELYSSADMPVLFIDGRLDPLNCTMDLYNALGVLEPFGQGNPEPVWIARGLYPATFRTVGRDDSHLQITFQTSNTALRAIGFDMGHRTSELNRPLDIAFRLKPDRWRGGDSVQLVLDDFKPAAGRID